ncbi:hypothetical protein GCM10022247_65180 [Allokutzneria multivorans]|uniref:Uncharacterized protein n=1 Tax=Allokutzneria multivorans TaxID=1142134 RepID=A0ABP7TTI6_9PSEU
MSNARAFFDAGSGALLWCSCEGWDDWGQPVDLELLPISQALRDELDRLISRYDTSLNWDYPPDPGPWREAECLEFNEAVRSAITQLRAELGPTWQIRDHTGEQHEDPDLDRYQADPAGFRRDQP